MTDPTDTTGDALALVEDLSPDALLALYREVFGRAPYHGWSMLDVARRIVEATR